MLAYFHKAGEDLSSFADEVAKKFSGMVRCVVIECAKENASAKLLGVDKCPSYVFLKPSYKGREKVKKAVKLIKPANNQDLVTQLRNAYKADVVSLTE